MVQRITDIPGLGTREFPDNFTDDQIKSAIQNELSDTPNTLQSGLIGLGAGLTNFGQGIKEKGLLAGEALGLTQPGSHEAYQQQVDDEQKLYDTTPVANSTSGMLGKFIGNALPYAAVPYGGLLNQLGRVGGSAAMGALSGATSYVPQGGSELAPIGVGAALGPLAEYGTSLAGKALTYPFAKTSNYLKGNFAPNVEKDVIDEGAKRGVDVFASDAAQSPFLETMARYAEKAPTGMVSAREVQMERAQNAAEEYGGNLLNEAKEIPHLGSADLQKLSKIANSDSKRGVAAQNLLNEIQSGSESILDMVKNSGNLKAFRLKLIADKKFSNVEKIANQLGIPVIAPKTYQAIDSIRNDILPMLGDADPTKIKLNQLIDKFQGKITQDPFTGKVVSDLKFGDLRNFRSQMNAMIADYFKGPNAVIGKNGVQLLQKASRNIEDDLTDYAQQQGGKLFSTYKDANNFYRNNLVPYKNKILAQSLRGATPEKVYDAFVKNTTREGNAKILYKALDDKGRAAVRAGIVDDALNVAKNEDLKRFSPSVFVNQLDKKVGAYKTFFSGKDLQEFEGFKKLMAHVTRANQTLKSPDTGVMNTGLILGTGGLATAAINPILPLAIGGGAYIARALMTNPRGRDFLLASSKLQPYSKSMETLIKRFEPMLKGVAIKYANESTSK
jgi:hypothetical protein